MFIRSVVSTFRPHSYLFPVHPTPTPLHQFHLSPLPFPTLYTFSTPPARFYISPPPSRLYTSPSSASSTSSASSATTGPSKVDVASFLTPLVKRLRKAAFFFEDHRLHKPNPSSSTPIMKSTTTLEQANSTWTQGLKVVEPDLENMTHNIVEMLAGSLIQPTHPLLAKIASYYFGLKGKRLRPVIVLLICHAVGASPTFRAEPTQLGLAQVVEMIHTGSLVHDDVIDEADTRRDMPTANARFGNKMAIMAGDFLLARASVSLARLRNMEVTELMATAMGDLIEGEFTQLRGSPNFEHYMKKTYLKTASLLEKGCRCAAILGGASREVVDMATEYGKNLGLAFQVVDDLLDFTGSAEELGKPAAVDLSLGLATAPVLYAREEFPELDAMIARKFSDAGDVERARQLVAQSQGIDRTRRLAAEYSQKAVQAIQHLPPSLSRDALLALPEVLLNRSR